MFFLSINFFFLSLIYRKSDEPVNIRSELSQVNSEICQVNNTPMEESESA